MQLTDGVVRAHGQAVAASQLARATKMAGMGGIADP